MLFCSEKNLNKLFHTIDVRTYIQVRFCASSTINFGYLCLHNRLSIVTYSFSNSKIISINYLNFNDLCYFEFFIEIKINHSYDQIIYEVN